MSVTSTYPTSRRGYLSQSELAEFADITITDTTEADDRISQAEEIIDAYVGAQPKFMYPDIVGPVAAVASTTFTLYTTQQNVYELDYFKGCEVEIIGGTGAGQRRKVTGSTKAGVVTIDTAWSTNPSASGSFYRLYQLGKFPRARDVQYFSEVGTPTYFKIVPENVKRAVAAQVQYIIEMGDKYFATDQSEKQSESIGDYSYTNGSTASGPGLNKLIAPKARQLLLGIKNRTGCIVY